MFCIQNPFNLNLNAEGKIESDQFKKNKQNKENKNFSNVEVHSDVKSLIDETNSSNGSSFSLFSSPRDDSSENLIKIDLTLDTQLTKSEIHQYLVDLFIKSNLKLNLILDHFKLKNKGKKTEKKFFFPKQWKSFPKVGESPSQTPDQSSPDISPREVTETKIKNEQSEIFIMSENKSNETIISKNKEFSSNQNENKNSLKIKDSIEKNEKSQQSTVIHLKSNEKNYYKGGLIVPLSIGTNTRSALPLKTNEKNSFCKRNKANRSINKIENFNKYKIFSKRSKKIINVDKNNLNKSIIRAIESSNNEPLSLDSNFENYGGINHKDSKIENLNTKQEKNQNLMCNSLMSLNECSKNRISSNKFDNQLDNFKTQDLFNHIYLNSNLPKRISSGIYRINRYDENNLNKIIINANMSSSNIATENDEKQENEEINISYFKNWLNNYKFKKSSLNYRMTQAKLNRDNIEFNRRENLLNSIFKENSKSFSAKSESLISINSVNYRTKSAENFSYVTIKTPYFVSQLEMQEILDEVNSKLLIDNKFNLNERNSASYLSDNKFINQNLSKKENNVKSYKMNKNVEKKTINCLKTNFRKEKKIPQFQFKIKKNDKLNVKESKSSTSFSNKTSLNDTKEYPEIKLQLNFPGSPEKYLLPIRFPILYNNLISKIKDF